MAEKTPRGFNRRKARKLAELVRGVLDPVETWSQPWQDGDQAHEIKVIRVDPKGRAHLLAGLQGSFSAAWVFGEEFDPPIAMLLLGVTRPAVTSFKLAFEAVDGDMHELDLIAQHGLIGITTSSRATGKLTVIRVPVDELRAFLERIRGG